jgi:APA family basic amino acid/polyamine antiporter
MSAPRDVFGAKVDFALRRGGESRARTHRKVDPGMAPCLRILACVRTERRQLGLATAIAIVTGESVGLGIFLTPATMASSLGAPLLLLLVWCGMGAMAMCGALCYAELAVRFPRSGGEYVYLREGWGSAAAFLYGWMSAFVMYPGVAAALALGGAAYLLALAPAHAQLARFVPALLLLAFAVVNVAGTRLSGALLTALNGLKLLVLLALPAWVAISGRAHLSNLAPFAARAPGSGPLFPALAGAVVSAFFSLGGWWEAGKIAGEVRDPERNLPRAFIVGVALVTAAYVLVSIAFLAVVPVSRMHADMAFLTQIGAALFGTAGAATLSACVLLCVCGGLGALAMAAPRVTFAMARAGDFFPLFGRRDARFETPVNAILLQTGLSLAVLLLGTFDRILAYIIFPAVLFMAITAAVLFRLPRRPRAWWFPAAPVVFIACSLAIATLIVMHDPGPALLGVAIILCGLPLRRLFFRQQKRDMLLTAEQA